MSRRQPELQAFVESFSSAVTESAAKARDALRTARQLATALPRPGTQARVTPARLPTCTFFAAALKAVPSGDAAEVAARLAGVEPFLAWRRRAGSVAGSSPFDDGHANATIVGPGGLEERDDLRIGVSLLAPKVDYPPHRHPPDEIYLALSEGQWRQDDAAWFSPGPGGIVFNASNTLHAMRAGSSPLLAVWGLWIGDYRQL